MAMVCTLILGGWEGPTVIVDQPILEEGGKAEEQEAYRDEEKEEREEREGDGPKQGQIHLNNNDTGLI